MKIFIDQESGPETEIDDSWDVESYNGGSCHDHAEELTEELFSAGSEVTATFKSDRFEVTDGISEFTVSDDTNHGAYMDTTVVKTWTI